MKKIQSLKSFLAECRRLVRKGYKVKLVEGRIRLKPPNGKKYCRCPITAVCENLGGGLFVLRDVYLAAEAMHLSNELSDRVMNATDCLDIYQKIRKKLLAVFGLKD